ncbi:MAG: chemotaxis protein MotB [Deltaproteobacteria bacterium]|nr:MAG: chemotaxis protein MotB [Deltaproteobacteria bacterium]
MKEKRAELSKQQEEVLKLKKTLQKREKEVAKLKKELSLARLKIREDIEQLRSAEKARREILYEIKATLAKQSIIVEVVDNDTVLRIPETTLTFLSNSYDIPNKPNLQEAIKKIGLALHKAILKPLNDHSSSIKRFKYLDTVFIEGHTDSRPTSRTKGNWGLSTFRAISLWEFWENSLDIKPSFGEMRNAFQQKLFSVSGYASSRRLQLIENTEEQRAMNRRIDIRFTIKRPTIKELKAVVE